MRDVVKDSSQGSKHAEYERRRAHLRNRHTLIGAICFGLMVTMFVIVSTIKWSFALQLARDPLNLNLLSAALFSWCGSILALGLFGLIQHLHNGLEHPSPLVVEVLLYVFFSWLVQVAYVSYDLLWARAQRSGSMDHAKQADVAQVIMGIFFGITCYLFTRSMGKRVAMTEKAFGCHLGSRHIFFVQHLIMLLQFTVGSAITHYRFMHLAFASFVEPLFLDFATNLVTICSHMALAILVFRSFRKPLAATKHCDKLPGAYTRAEAAWAHQALLALRRSMLTPCIVGVMLHSLQCLATLRFHNRLNDLVAGICSTAVMTTEAVCLLRVLGMFQMQKPELTLEVPSPPMALADEVQRGLTANRGSHWSTKVRELAMRSMPVEELLQFHAHLGRDTMPHYSPWESTTNDVVRHAIIPLTRTAHGGVAYASLLNPAKRADPTAECMVTHTWSSLFIDLVAAVVADALGLEEYSGIADVLAVGDHEHLERQLQAKGVHHKEYWMCAFCINQHASICGGFAHEPSIGTAAHAKWDATRRDTVTGEVYPCCCCQQPKFFNDKPEECELNKFDDMMFRINGVVPGFSQLIVIDRRFTVFTRIWCVAELVQAFNSRISQRVQLPSCKGLREDAQDLELYINLATLTVAHAEATRPEDKAAILEKIHDIGEFDAQLQVVIFGEHGLLKRCFAGFGIYCAAANIARRVQALADRVEDLESRF